MKPQVKITIIISFILLCLPFIFMQDIFPFFRFGMFAEPVRYESQYEHFVVFFAKKGEKRQFFEPESILLSRSHWDLLWRNAYYQNQAAEKLQLFAESRKGKGETWEVLRVVSKNKKMDTVCVAKFGL